MREQIASHEATLSHEWTLAEDIDKELSRARQRRAELSQHVAVLAEASARVEEELRQVESQCSGAAPGSASSARRSCRPRKHAWPSCASRCQREENEHLECMRQAGRLKNDAISYKAQVDNLTRERSRLLQRSELAAEHLASLDLELQELSSAEEELQSRLTRARQAVAELRQERDRLRQMRDETSKRSSDLREQRSGLVSRIEVLEGLERSHEGLGTGPRELFALLEQPDPGPWRTVMGILAEFLTVRREYAPLLDLALGERSQRFLVRDSDQLAQALRQRNQPFSSRVSFLPLRSTRGVGTGAAA